MLKVHPKIKLDYFVTGTGRCGTVYMARLLTSLGINCTHEAIFNYNGLEFAKKALHYKHLETSYCSVHDILHNLPIEPWIDINNEIQAESSYMAAPFLDNEVFKSTKIIHVVRNPLKVISSHVKDINFFEPHPKHNLWLNFVLSHMPEIKHIKNNIEKACYYYTNWNNMIELKIQKHQSMRHKVEDKYNQTLLEFINVQDSSNAFTNSTINSWKKRTDDLTIDEIPNGTIKKEFIEISQKYGYFLNPTSI